MIRPVLTALAALSIAACQAAPQPAQAPFTASAAGAGLAAEAQRFARLEALAASGSPEAQALLDRELGEEATPAAVQEAPLRLAVWSEFLPYEEVERHLGDLAARGVTLYLAVTPERATSSGLFALLRAAAARGVPVRPWLLLREEDGYWANKWNAPQVRRHVLSFLDGLEAEGLSTGWIILDVEPPATLTGALAARLKRFDLVGAHRLLAAASRDGALSEARAAYGGLVETLHARGVKVQAVSTPMILDDAPGHDRIESALGTPMSGVGWDEVSFMAYRPEFTRMVGRVGPDLVYRYALEARRRFGDRAGLDVGEVGSPGYPEPVPGYTDPRELEGDLAACRAAGLSRVNVFSLDGVIEQGGTARWLAVPEPAVPRREIKPALLRLFFRALARTLPEGR